MPKKKETSVTKKTKIEDKKEIKTEKKSNKILMTEEQKKEWLKSFSDIEKAIESLYKGDKNGKTDKVTKKRNKTTK